MDSFKRPPNWIISFLKYFLNTRIFDGIYGDLLEDYHRWLKNNNKLTADILFLMAGFGFLRHKNLHKKIFFYNQNKSINMLPGYIKSSFRNFNKRKAYFALNIAGLAVGITAFILIQAYVDFEKSYDVYHQNANRTFRITVLDQSNSQQKANYLPDLVPRLYVDFPEIDLATRFFLRQETTVQVEKNNTLEMTKHLNMLYTDENFLNVFSFQHVPVDLGHLLKKPNTAIITKKLAKNLFGDQTAVGKILGIKDTNFPLINYEVVSVIDLIPINTHFNFDLIVSMYTNVRNGRTMETLGWNGFYNYIVLDNAVKIIPFEQKLKSWEKQYFTDASNYTFRTQPLTDIHLKSNINFEFMHNGDAKIVRYLSILSYFILLMAYINYINFSTAQSEDRMKEVGIKKILGSSKLQLYSQFLMETVLINFMSIMFALLLIYLFTKSQIGSQILGIDLFFSMGWDLGLYLLLILFVGALLSGYYPAFILTSFQPSTVINGKINTIRKGFGLRGILIVVQFAISLALIISTIVIRDQIEFMMKKDKGINIDNIIVIKTPVIRGDDYRANLELFKNKLSSYPFVSSISTSSTTPGNGYNYSTQVRSVHQQPEETSSYYTDGIDESFIKHYGINLLGGRSFDAQFPNEGQNVLINLKAMKQLGFLSPASAINENIMMEGSTFTIIGVIQDYNHKSLKQDFDPIIFRYYGNYVPKFSAKINFIGSDDSWQNILEKFKTDYEGLFVNDKFDFYFLEEEFNKQYNSEIKFRRVSSVFSLIAIVIACMGLMGLVSFMVTKKAKEIALRKVLGSTNIEIIYMFSLKLVWLNIISGIIASGVTFYFLQQWINNFVFHIDLSPIYFLLPLILLMSISLIILVIRSIGTIRSNPIKWLNSER